MAVQEREGGVAVSQRTLERVSSDFHCKDTTFWRDVVCFCLFQSVTVRISLYMSVSVCLQLQVDAILLSYVFHCHWRQELVAGSYAEHDELVFMA